MCIRDRGWAIYQALPAQRDNPRFRAAAPWLIVNIILNGLWVFVFGREAFISTLPIMAVLVYTAVVAYRKLEIGRARVGTWERILQIPISIYLGWLTVAAVANVASALIAAGWNGFGISNEVWALVMLLVGAGLAVFLYRGLNNDVVVPLVYLYAYIGIIAWAIYQVLPANRDNPRFRAAAPWPVSYTHLTLPTNREV